MKPSLDFQVRVFQLGWLSSLIYRVLASYFSKGDAEF